MPLSFPLWWETSRSMVGYSAGNPVEMMLQTIAWLRSSYEISCDQWDLRPMLGSSGVWSLNGWDRGKLVHCLTGQERLYCCRVKCMVKGEIPCLLTEGRLRGIKISLFLDNQSLVWHFSEVICTAFIKLKCDCCSSKITPCWFMRVTKSLYQEHIGLQWEPCFFLHVVLSDTEFNSQCIPVSLSMG